MRIIAGSSGGLPLKPPPQGVRPTMDRVKAAVFSSLGDRVPGAAVLDLFAGSGAMGIEALSRGSNSAVFVESSDPCARCIRENLRRAGVSGSVQTMDAFRFLDLYAGEDAFDIIIADPPYVKKDHMADHAAALVASEKLAAALRPGGLFVLEKQRGGALPDSPLDFVKSARYGGSEIHYFIRR